MCRGMYYIFAHVAQWSRVDILFSWRDDIVNVLIRRHTRDSAYHSKRCSKLISRDKNASNTCIYCEF